MTERGLAPVQMYAVGICLVINMLDGFDVLAIAFTANEIANEWEMSPENLGILFSSGLLGMIIGALALAPVADAVGRRPQIVLCLCVIGLGMLVSGLATSISQLMVLRFITGIGIGGIIPSLNTMVAEYSARQWRNLSLSLLHIGYPLGVTIGGASAVYLLGEHGWRSVFLLGGALTFLMAVAVLFFLPESLIFLLEKQPKNALARANSLLVKLKRPVLKVLPETELTNEKANGLRLLFSKQYVLTSILLWVAFFMGMMTLYFLMTWLPKILIDAGMSTNEGISAGVVMSVGGMTGTMFLGLVSTRVDLIKIVQIYFGLAIVMMIGLGAFNLNLNALLVLTFTLGFLLFGGVAGLYMIGAWVFPSRIRSSGVGWAIGIGRTGAVLGPYLAGLLIGAGIEKWLYFSLFALPLLMAALAMGAMRLRTTIIASQ